MTRYFRQGKVVIRWIPIPKSNPTAMDVAMGTDLSRMIWGIEGWMLTHEGRSSLTFNDASLADMFAPTTTGAVVFAPRGLHGDCPLSVWPCMAAERTWYSDGRLRVDFVVECQCNNCCRGQVTWRGFFRASKTRVAEAAYIKARLAGSG